MSTVKHDGGRRRASVLILSSALLACSREPPFAAPPALDSGSAAPAPAPSNSLTTASTASTSDAPDHPVSIPGVLTIRAPARSSPSHGVGLEPWRAAFLLTNETEAPLSVQVSEIVLRSEEAGLAPEDRIQPLAVNGARAEKAAALIEGGTVTFTVPPRRQIGVDLDGDVQQKLRVHYHVSYHHEAVFSVGGARVVGRGYTMSFRRPLVRP